MRSANEIRNTEFVKSAFGGYKQEDVEIFLDELAADFEKLRNENEELTRKCAELQKRIEDFQGSETSLQSILMSAQKLAESIVADAKEKADKVIETTSDKATEILSEANKGAEALKLKSEAEATRILGEAVQKSRTLIAGAEDRAKRQGQLFDKYKAHSASFKNELIANYKKQLELILSMPDVAPESPVDVPETGAADVQPIADIAADPLDKPVVELNDIADDNDTVNDISSGAAVDISGGFVVKEVPAEGIRGSIKFGDDE